MRLLIILAVLLATPATASAKHHSKQHYKIISPHPGNTWPEVLAYIQRDAHNRIKARQEAKEDDPEPIGPPFKSNCGCGTYSPSMWW